MRAHFICFLPILHTKNSTLTQDIITEMEGNFAHYIEKLK